MRRNVDLFWVVAATPQIVQQDTVTGISVLKYTLQWPWQATQWPTV